jgi:4-amino-4-deoxy-L-arabinose transferase-like glycosyltransferase
MTARPVAQRRRVLAVALLCGVVLFVWQLGSTGLVDETPPLFAASARSMVERADWLIPHVNGLPRYDKPPLVYWLMGALYALPGQSRWDPLGSWAACLPSALASVALLLAVVDTLLCWPQIGPGATDDNAGPPPPPPTPPPPRHPTESRNATAKPLEPRPAPALAAPGRPGLTALSAGLAYGLSPLVFAWGRISVSDALFSATLGLSLLLAWRTYADPRGHWWHPWPCLGLAVLAKGPVAVVLLTLSLLCFAWLQGNGPELWRRLRPLRGLLIALAISGPWYALALWREGQPFWASFFGYHNLQRFASVVNHHLQPWWFFGPVLLVCSLPFTALLLLGLARAIGPLEANLRRPAQPRPAALSLDRFAACWLLAVLLFFTSAATKLPSYWLPATPAAALLIAIAAAGSPSAPAATVDRPRRLAWWITLLLTLLLAGVFLAGPLWVPLIRDPEMPELPAALLASGRLPLAAACWLAAAGLGWWQWRRSRPLGLLSLQAPLLLYVAIVLVPLWDLGDRVRALPVRSVASQLKRLERAAEPLAMVGILKPSLHFYTGRVVIYEGDQPSDLVNLADRLRRARRPGQPPSDPSRQPSVLVVIDERTASSPWWRGLEPQRLGGAGLYQLWRLDRRRLERRAGQLRAKGVTTTWDLPRPERY